MSDLFLQFLNKARKDYTPPKTLIALDPGETTGLAIFRNGMLDVIDQLPTHYVAPDGVKILNNLFLTEKPDAVVYENYLVYDWKTKSHSWNTLHTPRLIGSIQTLTYLQKIPVYTQMAQQPKKFVTDARLDDWKYYKKGQKHARDAIRHGTYYMLFNDGKK